MQDGHPIEYAPRALTPAEQNYAQIEKELLSVVFVVEKFTHLIYGIRKEHHQRFQTTAGSFEALVHTLSRAYLTVAQETSCPDYVLPVTDDAEDQETVNIIAVSDDRNAEI